jgi:hypothetical protein
MLRIKNNDYSYGLCEKFQDNISGKCSGIMFIYKF